MRTMLVFLGLATSAHGAEMMINGAGATFPYPIYSKWFAEYQKKDASAAFNYQSIGSGGGIRQLTDKTVDFGASDAPMTDEQMKKAGAPILHVPTVLGAVVITYGVAGLSTPLKLSGEAVAAVFLGKVTRWSDPAIASTNPGVKLPDEPIAVVHRSDGSGTTAVFADYLAKISPEWKEKVGTGTSLSWPTGLGAKGNEGVTGLVKQTPGALGYVELVYAESNKLPIAQVRNAAGSFVTPTPATVTAAAAKARIPSDFRVSITNAEGKDAYPISALTYLLVYSKMEPAKGGKLRAFIEWALTEGQGLATVLSYAPLPKAVAEKAKASVAGLGR